MRAAALQFDVTPDHQRNLALVTEQLRAASERGIELVVLPELWPSSFPATSEGLGARVGQDERAVERLRDLSAELGLCLAGSGLGREGDLVHNRLSVFDGGDELLRYDKIHLFSPTAEHEVFAGGERAPDTVDSSVGRISGAVCYDLRFPELFRVASRERVEIFLLPAQWPEPRAMHWRTLVVARAVENQCFIVACNRTGSAEIGRRKLQLEFPGNSLIVSPHGEVLAEGRGGLELVEAELDLDQVRQYRRRVPVLKDERVGLYRRWLETGR